MHTTPAPTPSPTAAPPVHLLLAVGLGLVGLARPITNTVLDQIGVDPGPVVPLGWTLLITLLWVAVVGLGRVPRPLLTLTLAGLVYGLSALLLSGILSPLLLGRLEGPLDRADARHQHAVGTGGRRPRPGNPARPPLTGGLSRGGGATTAPPAPGSRARASRAHG